jgi:hypothetical protein
LNGGELKPSRARALVVVALAVAAASLIAACGGGNNEDPKQVLTETFSNPTPVESGTFDLDLKIETNGGSNPGTLEVKLGGKFQSRGQGQFPAFNVDVSLRGESGSHTITGSGGLISTGDRAFINYQGTNYAVPQQLYDEFVASYAQLQGQNSGRGTGLLQRLNISLASWLTNLQNQGTDDIEGQKTIHVSGQANVPQIVADLKKIAQSAGSAVGNVNLSQLDQLTNVIQSGDIDVYTGETDKHLRSLQISFDLKPPAGTPGAPTSLNFDMQLNFANVNKPQTITAPASSEPLQNLLQRTGINLGRLGGALRGGLGTSGALPQSGGSTTAPSGSATQAYEQCLQQATSQAALQQCSKLLGQ